LLELVIGAAVMCEDKAEFIPKIFELNDASQAVLKVLVEQAMGRADDLDEAERSDSVDMTGETAAGAGMEDLRLSSSMSNEEQVRFVCS
jgi:hypothetical protein